ncbi:Pip5kl1 [Symbiodinium pilosum]|uniref:Pip5kl1 protein n=1 Tax=Symbiodinium pilosum TaxID=2952 RepID=A0A812XTC4_SYMPI|nr:Pip5kl1 [Symbiodinium pilosum]
MQLLTFAQWQMSCEADERKLLFTYFLILVTKKTLSQNAMVRFAHMFVEIGTEIMEKDVEGEAAKAWSDLQSAAEDPELDEIHTAEAKLEKLKAFLQTVAFSVLESDWKPESWHVPEPSTEQGIRSEALPMLLKKADPIVRALTKRWGIPKIGCTSLGSL